MDRFLQDLRYTLRMLRERPSFTAVVILSLALGIGANTAVFSVFRAAVLDPPPYAEPARIVVIGTSWAEEGGKTSESMHWSYPLYQEFSARTESFESLAATWTRDFNLGGSDAAERVRVELVSAPYFSVLEVRPSLGRLFLEEEDATPGSHPVVLLGHGLWVRQYGADRDIIGQTIELNDTTLEVIGILPDGFHGISENADAWVPMMMAPSLTFRSRLTNPHSSWAQVVGRLRDDLTLAGVLAEFGPVARSVEEILPAGVIPPTSSLNFTAQTLQQTRIDQALANPLYVLLGVVGLVLLIACANVAHLLLARGIGRRSEFALRLAVGAEPRRIMRQVLTESIVMAALGGAVGVLVALWTLEILRALRPAALAEVFELRGVALDGKVLGFLLLVSLASGVLFGLLPALHAARTNVSESLKKASRRTATGLFRLGRPNSRGILVTGQIAVAMLLLIGAGLMVKSLTVLQSQDLGFQPDNLLTARLSLPRSYNRERSTLLLQQILATSAAQPGVQSAALAYCLPIEGGCDITGMTLEGRTLEQPYFVAVNMVSSGYFEALEIPLVVGRGFEDSDRNDSLRVAVIGETLAREAWPGEEPIGKRIRLGLGWPEGEWAEVVGVARDVRHGPITEKLRSAVYLPYQQFAYDSHYFILRGTGRSGRLTGMLRDRLASLDPSLPLFDVTAMSTRIATSISRARLGAWLLGAFAVLGTALALGGVYSVVSYAIAQRTREIGIRLTLGARSQDVLRLVLGEVLLLTALGITIGLGGALAASRTLVGELYLVSRFDPLTYGTLAVAMAAVALLACYIPARRALAIEPIHALREN